MNGHSPVALRRSERKRPLGLPGCMQPPGGAAGRVRRKLQIGEVHLGRQARTDAALLHLLCHLVTSVPALNARPEDASPLKPSLGMLLENQSPVWWVGNSLWKDLHGTPTGPSGGDSRGTPLLCSEPWFPPVYRGDGDYTPAPAEPGSQLGVMKMTCLTGVRILQSGTGPTVGHGKMTSMER